MTSLIVAGRRLEITRGDITRESVDAVANAANGTLRARSVAFPAISMGIYGYPGPEGAGVAVRTVAEHLRGATAIELARFVLFSDQTHGLFADALADLDSE